MPWRSKKLWAAVVVCVLVVLFIVNASVRRANRMQGIATQKMSGLGAVAGDDSWGFGFWQDDMYKSDPMDIVAYSPARAEKPDPDHKIIHTVALELVVKDVQQSVVQIRRRTIDLGGFVERASIAHADNGADYATITLRVPQANLEQALNGFKQQAVKVANEMIESTDVTRQFSDSQAQLRNYKAEEEQYLTIMRRASTVKDTLDVAKELSDVRGRIEKLQGEFNHLSHQVAMSSVTVTVRPETSAIQAALEWHPLVSAKRAGRNMLAGLANFADFIVALIINIPLIALWVCLIGAAVVYGWKSLRWGYGKMRTNTVAAPKSAEG